MAVKSITGSAGQGTGSEIQNPDRRDFVGNIRNTPLMSAWSQLDLGKELNRNDETRNDVDFEDGHSPVLKSNHDRNENAHHKSFFIKNSFIENVISVSREHIDLFWAINDT